MNLYWCYYAIHSTLFLVHHCSSSTSSVCYVLAGSMGALSECTCGNWGGYPLATGTGSQISSRLLSMVSSNALLMLPPSSDEKQVVYTNELVDALVIGRV